MTRREQRRRRAGRGLIVWATLAAVLLAAGTVTGIAVAASMPVAFPTAPASPTTSETPIASPEASPEASPTQAVAPAPPAGDPSPADTPCDSTVTMSVWAHYDDDLIFMNPAVADAIAAGNCVRTVFLTAGDAGKGKTYANGRELGIFRAYNDMRGTQGFWHEKEVTLRTGMEASLWSPDGDPKITLTFLHLPDGFLDGSGFDATAHASLVKLATGKIPTIAPIDGSPAVTKPQLVASIAELIGAFHPQQMMTHVPGLVDLSQGDHSDHATTGTLVRQAASESGYPLSQVSYLVGYPSEKLPANVFGPTLAHKVETFRIYAANDPVVACKDYKACLEKRRFGDWLQRHYVKSDAELFPGG